MKYFILFAAILGLTSATWKEQVLEKLNNNEHRLNEALAYSHAHQLTFHQGVYENFLKQVAESRKLVPNLENGGGPGTIFDKLNDAIELEKQIAAAIVNPSPAETAKTSAIYLAAMKQLSTYEADHQTAQKLIDDVLAIVKQEAWNRANPSSNPKFNIMPGIKLDNMYANLKSSTSGWVVPGFEDYYKLANNTRVLIESYRDHEMAEETTKMEEHLSKYDEITLAMARSWPIKDEKDVDHYYALAKTHREHEMAMETAKKPIYDLKDGFLDTLYGAQKRLQEGIEHFRSRHQFYYAEWLALETKSLNETIEDLKHKPRDVVVRQSYQLHYSVQGTEASVRFAILRPAQDQTLLAAALYIAALKEANLDTVHSNVTSVEIKAQVAAIIHAEAPFFKPGMNVRQRIDALGFQPGIDRMRVALKEMLRKDYELRGMNDKDDDLELENMVKAKIEDLKRAGKTQEASEADSDLGLFIIRTYNMNSILPIDSEDKLESYYRGVKSHWESAQKLQAFLNKKV